VRGPAVIGRGARIVDSYIGPYTAIGDDVVIERSEVEHSIVLAGAQVRDLPGRVEASLIGRDVSITRTQALPRVFRFVVGDGSDITIL
jgi:glucose-1-phosphate thymidylyltransferase